MSALPYISRWRTFLQLLKNAQIPIDQLNHFMNKNGSSAKFRAGGRYPMIITTDPELSQHILLKNQKNYSKNSYSYNIIRKFWGQGLLTSQGEQWKQDRKMIRPCFHSGRLKKLFQLMDGVTESYLNELDTKIAKGTIRDMYSDMQELTFRIIANATFSSSMDQRDFDKINHAISEVQGFVIDITRKPYLNWFKKVTGKLKSKEEIRDKEWSVIQKYIQERRKNPGEYNDFLQMLMDIRYEDTGEGITDKQLVDEINILFIAGHETSATGLAWAWYLLGKHPEVLEKVRQEVDQVIDGNEISYEDLSKLTYTQQVLEETIRLYPPIWGTNRVAVDDDEFKGIKIKKGTICGIYTYGIHPSEKLWEDPEAFNPDRFSRENKKGRHTFAYIPFGGGPRFCIGRQFALMEMKMVLAKMIKRYDFELLSGQKVEANPEINLRPGKAIKARLKVKENIPSPKGKEEVLPGHFIHPELAGGKKGGKCPFHFLHG
ncbi:MAG: cytochrome P450 [Bacteroidia bacterium]|nr:cytochrome P450 [Bacteroidia bacterium]